MSSGLAGTTSWADERGLGEAEDGSGERGTGGATRQQVPHDAAVVGPVQLAPQELLELLLARVMVQGRSAVLGRRER